MDEETQTEAAFRSALRDLEFLNRITFAYYPVLGWLDRIVRERSLKTLSVLDVGAGGGDMLRRIAAWAEKRGIAVELTGLDRSPWAGEAARAAGTPGQWITADLFTLDETARYDVVIASLFAHHLPDPELTRFLRWMEARARIGWLVSDIHRNFIPWLALWAGTRILRLDPMVVHDSTASVSRAFHKADLRRVADGAQVDARIAWHPLFRWTLSSARAS